LTIDEIETCEMEVEERRVTFDIEIDDRGEFSKSAHRRIISIAAHDSYTGEKEVFVDTEQVQCEDFPTPRSDGRRSS
jgi:DNA polymerase I